jgi:hypothetical protein
MVVLGAGGWGLGSHNTKTNAVVVTNFLGQPQTQTLAMHLPSP